jgi:hypothetical protein
MGYRRQTFVQIQGFLAAIRGCKARRVTTSSTIMEGIRKLRVKMVRHISLANKARHSALTACLGIIGTTDTYANSRAMARQVSYRKEPE